jgi:hypothetical protein
MSFPGYARVAGGADDDAAYFGASIDVDGAVDAALRALDDGPSLGASAGNGSNGAGSSGRSGAYYGGRQPGPQAPRRRPLGPNAVVTPPPSLPDSVFCFRVLPSGEGRRRWKPLQLAASCARVCYCSVTYAPASGDARERARPAPGGGTRHVSLW